MIKDRLTAKFQSAKATIKRTAKTVSVAKPKAKEDPVADAYDRGRAAAGSFFWL